MKFIKVSVITAGMLFSSLANAQAKNHEGFSVGVNPGFETHTIEVSTSEGSLNGFGKSNTLANIFGSYTFALSDKNTLAFSAVYDLTENTVYSENAKVLTSGTSIKLKSRSSFNIEPGYALSNELLTYLKFGYHTGEYSLLSISKSVNGVSYGIGAKYLFTQNIFATLEIQRIDYFFGKM